MTNKIILTVCTACLFLSGCIDKPATGNRYSDDPIEVVEVDLEAAALGFPEIFISREKEDIDWSKATSERVAGMNVQLFDTGRTVDVCGGIGCDK